jgi:dienelactone hydrolase
LKGYALSPGQKVTIEAVDQNTGNRVTLGTIAAATSGISYATSQGVKYKLYPWTYEPGVLAANYWAPQSIVPVLATSQGHLDLRASIDHNTILPTFSQPALSSLKLSLLTSHDFLEAAKRNSDGNTTVLFDQDGVGSPSGTSWTNVQGMVSNSPSGNFFPVAWSVGSYTVEGKNIYALICAPTQGIASPVVIYNHGGLDNTNGGNINGVVTASGWTALPSLLPDSLGQCLDWAKRGWVFATSSYRGESVNITSMSPEFPAPPTPWLSDGNVEFCMGEVTDVMALTDLLVNHASSITVGSTANPHHINVNGKVFMYGYSHGGCITYRAVEQGAAVNAFAVIEGFTDFNLNYLNYINLNYLNHISPNQTPAQAAVGAGACLQVTCPPGSAATAYYYPDASGVMGYNWRSAHYFASRGDLAIEKFKTMPILILHGDVDPGNPAFPDAINPVFLDEPVELAADIKATDIFVGPTGFPLPTSQPCITGPAGAPIVDSTAAHAPMVSLASCPVSFTVMDPGDTCVSGGTVPAQLPLCSLVLSLPLTPPAGQAQQLHYLVVYHNMNHTNGGLAIEKQFDRFVEQSFATLPGCDGVGTICNGN